MAAQDPRLSLMGERRHVSAHFKNSHHNFEQKPFMPLG
jgi:hypothetical protein